MAETGRPSRVPKTLELRVRDCEAHLHFLREALRKYQTEPDRYKQIAAELRVLVVRYGKSNKALLLDLLDEFQLEFKVPPPGPPFQNRPVAVLGSVTDPTFEAWRSAVGRLGSDPSAQAEVDALTIALRPSLLLDEYLERGLAVQIGPREYSHKQLIQAVSQQMGSSHEDTEVDESLAALHSFRIGGEVSYVPPLLKVAELVLQAGNLLIAHAKRELGYTPRYSGSG